MPLRRLAVLLPLLTTLLATTLVALLVPSTAQAQPAAAPGRLPKLSLHLSSSIIYPHLDGYLDRVRIQSHGTETAYSTMIEILDPQGRVRMTSPGVTVLFYGTFFDGTGEHPATPGHYTVRLTSFEQDGRKRVRNKPLVVSLKYLQVQHVHHTYAAADVVSNKSVGSCSELASPSSHGWKGSLGFYSQIRCGRAQDSVVATVAGIYLPKALRYGDFGVDVYGGGARGRARDHAPAYLVLGYLGTKNTFSDRAQLPAKVGLHRGRTVRLGGLIHGKDTAKPYVLWQTGLSEGSRYDVRSFAVHYDYYRLVSPGA